MATKVTEQDKIQMNELYLKLRTYAGVARETGFSASTVKKYIIPNYVSIENIKIKKFDKEIPADFPPYPTSGLEWLQLLAVSPQEWEEIKELRKEVLI